MELGPIFYVIAGLWGVAVILNLVMAARFCAAIEERSGTREPKSGLPNFLAIVPVALNQGVSQDDETQALRWQMNKRLIVIGVGFVVFFFFVGIWTEGAL